MPVDSEDHLIEVSGLVEAVFQVDIEAVMVVHLFQTIEVVAKVVEQEEWQILQE